MTSGTFSIHSSALLCIVRTFHSAIRCAASQVYSQHLQRRSLSSFAACHHHSHVYNTTFISHDALLSIFPASLPRSRSTPPTEFSTRRVSLSITVYTPNQKSESDYDINGILLSYSAPGALVARLPGARSSARLQQPFQLCSGI